MSSDLKPSAATRAPKRRAPSESPDIQALVRTYTRWWNQLSDETASSFWRADRAVLRRQSDVLGVMLSPAYQRLHRKLVAACWPDEAAQSEAAEASGAAPFMGHWREHELERLAAIAALLAHVRVNDPERSLPVAMSKAPPKDGRVSDDKPVSDLRFRHLLDAPDTDSLFVALRRLMPLMSHSTSVEQLVRDVWLWGDHVRRDWAYHYRWKEAP